MFNPAAVLSAAFGDHLAETYLKAFPEQKPHYAQTLIDVGRDALVLISTSDAPYHNAEHTMMVTLVGQQIILGQQKTGVLHPEDWLHYIVALLLHDIGFARGACEGDTPNEVVINDAAERVCPPRGASDAVLGPYHVDRGRIYARQRFAGSDIIDAARIARAIDYTRFPVPDDPAYANTESEPALVRAADLIGQIADPFYLCKLNALYSEFVETGFADKLGCRSAMDLVEQFPGFFHEQVEPLIGPALDHLRQTPEGKEVIARLQRRLSDTSFSKNPFGPFPGP
ncbi:MAG: metal-dependent phosphohydrolase [Pseudomonadota bacterium]